MSTQRDHPSAPANSNAKGPTFMAHTPRRLQRIIVAAAVLTLAAAAQASAAPPNYPGTADPIGPATVVRHNCVTWNPARSGAALPANGLYLVGFSTPDKGMLQFDVDRHHFASWTKGLHLAREDFGIGYFGDFFATSTKAGPQTVCFKGVAQLYYQAWYDTTGLLPDLAALLGDPDGSTAFQGYGNSAVVKLTYPKPRPRR